MVLDDFGGTFFGCRVPGRLFGLSVNLEATVPVPALDFVSVLRSHPGYGGGLCLL